ncbi:MAG: T9SS type A sorting domain-containing protein [Bacteroidota bacterium]
MSWPKAISWIFVFTLILPFFCTGQTSSDSLRSVKMSAAVNEQATSITVKWLDDNGVNSYKLYKKLPQEISWGLPLVESGDQAGTYVDTDVEEGQLYEYRILKQTGGATGYAYLFSGINYTPPQKRGDVLLVVDSIAADFVEDRLQTYMGVLRAEGWIPTLATVPSGSSVPEVKSLILQHYADLDSLRTVVLMGDIAVPHSGDITPDGHSNHRGAWPADGYYGDVDGIWTDSLVNYRLSKYPRVRNEPGDGKFDQDTFPTQLEMVVGRLDFSELPVYMLNEYQLLDQYLQKNIEFRTGQYQSRRRAAFTNHNLWTEGIGQNAIRNFTPLVSNDSINYRGIFDAFEEPYLWTYYGSSGYMFGAYLLGDVHLFANSNFQATFTTFFGSTYGDFDHENNFLRTVLASGRVLSTAWVGAPHWYFHPMAMGMDLGFCTSLTQNNSSVYYPGVQAKYMSINLLGDPTLKSFIVLPPSNLSVEQELNHVFLDWLPSNDDVLGYQVYRKLEGMDYFEALNDRPITATSFVDSCVMGEMAMQYLVKAVKKEVTPSGSFINHSNGPIVSIQTSINILPKAEFTLSWANGLLSAVNQSANASQYQWMLPDGTSSDEETFEIPFDQSGEISVTLIASNDCYSDTLEQLILLTNLKAPGDIKEVSIFPNPVQDFVTVKTAELIDEIRIYDVLGNQLMTKSRLNAGMHRIDMRDMEEGIYLFKIRIGDQQIPKMILLNRL